MGVRGEVGFDAGPVTDPSPATDLSKASLDARVDPTASPTAVPSPALEQSAIPTDSSLIDQARQTSGHHHHHHATLGERIAHEHDALRAAGREGPQFVQPAVINSTRAASTGPGTSGNEQLHEHILSLLATGSKRRESVTDDAELAEFIRQHPELTQYIKQLQEARDTALQKAQESRQTGLESAANLNAKLDVIATLLEGSPLAPALRMGDTVAKEAFIQESEKAFDDPEEGAALAEYVWNLAADRARAAEQQRSEQIAAGERQLEGRVDTGELARIAQLISNDPANAAQAIRELRNTMEDAGVNMDSALDPSTPEGMALASMIEKNSPSSDVARQLTVMLFAAQLHAETHETSAALSSERTIDRYLALDAADKKLVDSYFEATSQTTADRYLFEAYTGMRRYQREQGSTILERQPVENSEQIVAKIVLARAAAEGMHYEFQNFRALDEGIFRKTVERIFDTSFGNRPSQHEVCRRMPGGIRALDRFDEYTRVQGARVVLDSLAAANVELTGPALAAHRAEILTGILPVALATDERTQINLAPRFIAILEAMPAEERRELAAAYQQKTGLSFEQAARSYAGGSVGEATMNSLFVLMAVDSETANELLTSEEITTKVDKLAANLAANNPEQLSLSARELHESLTAQGISSIRALDMSLDEGRALDVMLRERLKDDALVRQAKAALFAVELERQAGPASSTLPSQEMIAYLLALPKDEKAIVQRYFEGINEGSAEKYLFEAFSGTRGYQPLNWEMDEPRAARPDTKQIVAALILSAAEERGQPIQLRDGQLADPNAPHNEVVAMFAGDRADKVNYVFGSTLPNTIQPDELRALCRQALLVRNLQGLDNGSSQRPAAEVDQRNAAMLAENLQHMLAADPNGGGSLATPLVAFLSQLPPERRDGLREEYQKQTGRDLIADFRAGMAGQEPARADFICGNAAMLLGRDDYERSAGFIAQSLAASGKLTPETLSDLMRGLDADGCLQGNPQSIERLNNTIAAYERVSGNGETFEKLLQRNEIPVSLIEALRTGDRAVVDACLVRANLKGSENPIQQIHQLLGGEFNLNSRPELAAAYERTFGEKFGDVREAVVLAAAAEYRESVESRRRTVDTLRRADQRSLEEFQNQDLGGAVQFFYIWDGAYETQAKDLARQTEETSQITDLYVERAARLRQVDAWTQEGSNLLRQVAELQAQGETARAAELDQQATVLFTRAQCRMLDVPYPSDTFEARSEAAQTLAREHAELVRANASAADIQQKEREARAAFESLITGPWSPNQTQLVRESIKSVLEINPSLDPRRYPDANPRVTRLMSNEQSTGYLDRVPPSALALTEEENQALDQALPGLRGQQLRDLIAHKRAQFEIEAEFARNNMRPSGERNLALLELEYRYLRRQNMEEFQKDWAKVMDNFDRTEGQLKAVRTGVLVVGSMATGGAGLPYLLAITAGSHAVQGAGDVAYGNKSWKDAGRTFLNEGGKDLLNVAMGGGMASIMKGGQVASFLGRASGNGVQASTFLGRTALVGRQLAVSGASGSTFGLAMEGTNLAWDVSMHRAGMSDREVTFDEMRTRLLTAGATGFLGGTVGGGSAMLRANIGGTGALSSMGRGLVSTAEYGLAGGMAQFQVGWGPNGSFGVHHQGFDVFNTVMAVGSTYVGNKAASHHLPGGNPNQVRSFAMFQPEPGVYSTPGVRNFSLHAAELKPVTDRVGAMFGLGEATPIDSSAISRQAAVLSAEIAQVETALRLGYEMVAPDAPDSSPLLMAAAGAGPAKPPQLPSSDLPQLPGAGDSNAIVLSAEPETPSLQPTGDGNKPAAPSTDTQPSTSDSTALALVEEQPAAPSTTPGSDSADPAQRRFLSAEERARLEERLALLREEFQDGLGKAKTDKSDRRIDDRADAKIDALSATESEALRSARAERIEIQAQLKKEGSDAVSGEARQRLEDRLRVLNEKTIPIETRADALAKKYSPDPSNADEYARMNQAIREVARIEGLHRRAGVLIGVSEEQRLQLAAAYKVLDDVRYTRKVNDRLSSSLDKLERSAEQHGWAPERLQAERALHRERANLKILERTQPEGPDKALQRLRITEQLDTAKREVRLEREVHRFVRDFGAGTPAEIAAARDFLRVRREFFAAGAQASEALRERFTSLSRQVYMVCEAAKTTAAVNAHNSKLDAKFNRTVERIDASSNFQPLKDARREEAQLRTLLRSHRREPEIVTKALDVVAQEMRTERSRTLPGQDNPRIRELTQLQERLSSWQEAERGAVRRNEGPFSSRQVSADERRTFESARELLQTRLDQLRTVELPELRQVNAYTGKKYQRSPEVVQAAERLVAAEREFGISARDAVALDGAIVPQHPEIAAARAELAEAKRLARTEMSRVDRLAHLSQQATKHGWHPDLINAKAALIECDAAVQRTKGLPSTNEQRELALANRRAAREQIAIERAVFRDAIKNGYGSPQEIRLARELAVLARDTNFDPVLGTADNPRYTETAARLNRLQAAHAQRHRDEAHNRSVDNRITARERRIDAREELPELKDLRKQLQRAEAAYDRRGKERVNALADAMLTEKIDDLRNRIPRAERVDELARRNGYSSRAEIEAARTIAALEQKMGIRNPTMDEMRSRLSPDEQAELQSAWSRYQDAQTDARRVAFNDRVDRFTNRRMAAIDEKPWIAERKAAAREEIRLEGELKKLKGSSPEVEARREQLREQLTAHRQGALRDAQRLDFLARTRGRGTEAEVTAARNVIEAEHRARSSGDAGAAPGQPTVVEALDHLRFERNRVRAENKYVARAIRAEWIRDYSAQSLVEAVIPSTTAMVVRASAASNNAIGTPDTPLEERVATFETIFDRKLRPDEVEFLSFVPDAMYKEAVRRIEAGWTPSRPSVAALPQGRTVLEGTVIDSPALSPAPEGPLRALPVAPERVIVSAAEPEPVVVRAPTEASDAPVYSPRDEREIAELFARNLETELLRGRDTRGNPIDPVRTRENLIAQKERVGALLDQEIAMQRKMIELGNEAARRGELPGGIKVDPETIRQTQRELFQEIEALDRAAERVRREIDDLRRQQQGSFDDQLFARRRSDDDFLTARRDRDEAVFEPLRDFSSDGDDNWWRTGGSPPEFRPTGGSGSGGTSTTTRTVIPPVRERVGFAPFESSRTGSILEPLNQSDHAPTARRGFTPMNEREIDNFMLGVDDLEGSALDAVLGHIDQVEGRAPAARPAPFRPSSDTFGSSSPAARRPAYSEPEPTIRPQPMRQPVAESAPRVQVEVATEARPFDFKFEVPTQTAETSLAIFTPELETHMAALSAAVDEVVPVRTTTIQPHRQPATVTPEAVPQVITQPEAAVATSTGQLLGRLTRTDSHTDSEVELNPALRHDPEPEPSARTKAVAEDATRTERRVNRRPDEGVGSPDSKSEDLRKKDHKTEEERKKRILELARSEKKGGAKLRYTKLVDEEGNEDLLVEDEEAGSA